MKKALLKFIAAVMVMSSIPISLVAEAKGVINWIVEPSMVYDNIYDFDDGLAGVRCGRDEIIDEYGYSSYNNYHGVINDQGKEIIPCSPDNPKFGWGTGLGGGYAWLTKDGETTIYNYNGDIAAVLPYENIDYFNKGLFVVRTEDSTMLININGEIIVSCPQTLDYCSVYKWQDSFVEFSQRTNDYSETSISLYDYNGVCIFEDLEGLNKFYDYYDYKVFAYSIQKGGKYGLIDKNANMLTDIAFDTMERTREQTILTSQDGKFGMINKDGSVIIPCDYDTMERCSNNFENASYKVSKNGQYGVIDTYGNIIAPVKYLYIYANSNDIIVCRKEGGTERLPAYDYIDSNGNLVYSVEQGFPYGVDKLSDNCYKTPSGLVNSEGNIIMEMETSSACMVDDNTVFIVSSYETGKEYMFYYLHEDTVKELSEFTRYSSISNSGIIALEKDEFFGAVNSNAETVIPFEYESIYSVTNNSFLQIKKNGKYGIADYQGNILIPCEYSDINAEYVWSSYYKYSIEGTKDGNKYYGYIDENNKLVVPCIYDDVYAGSNGYIVKKDNKYGMISKNGEIIVDTVYDSASFMDNKYIKIMQNDKYGLLDLNGETVFPAIFDEIQTGGTNCFLVESNEKCGIISENGDIIFSIEYDDIYFTKFSGSNTSVYNDGCVCILRKDTDGDGFSDSYGMADSNSGDIILNCEYSEITLDNQIIKIQDKDGLWGLAKLEEVKEVFLSSVLEDDELKITVNDNSEDVIEKDIIVAFYNDENIVETKMQKSNSVEDILTFELPQEECDSYKIFAWDKIEKMKPLADMISETILISDDMMG